MTDMNFDQLLQTYQQATDRWVDTIRAEEALATADHSMKEMERWDTAGLAIHGVEKDAKEARDRYKNALRQKNYGF